MAEGRLRTRADERAARPARRPASARSTRSTSSGRRASRPRRGAIARAPIGGAAYTSPHVSGWHERLETDRRRLRARRRARARATRRRSDATQFETVTAAAFADFAGARTSTSPSIEAGLGGRHDATNVIDAPVVLLTNVGLEHTEVLGETREAIAAREARGRAARARPSCCRTTSSRRSSPGARSGSAARARRPRPSSGAPVDALAEAALPGRLEIRGRRGPRRRAHAGGGRLAARAAARSPATTSSSPRSSRDKDADGILERLAQRGPHARRDPLLERRGRWPRPRSRLAARDWFSTGSRRPTIPQRRARSARGASGRRVLVTGSLYLLADLSADE